MTVVKLWPPSPRRTDNITCVPEVVYDADGDRGFTFQFAWSINGNGVLLPANATMLPSARLLKNDFVVCQVRASDGITWGAYSAPVNVTVGAFLLLSFSMNELWCFRNTANSPPVIAPFAPTPNNMANPSSLSCTPSSVSDPDNDQVPSASYQFQWFVNNAAVGGATSNSFTAFVRPNSVQCRLSVTDNDPTHPLTATLMSSVLLIGAFCVCEIRVV